MSKTIVDLPKVAQMLDAGWQVRIYKGGMGSYEVRARHENDDRMSALVKKLVEGMSEDKTFLKTMNMTAEEAVFECDFHGDELMTDDFTPEQALTRMAYKVFGEII